jgi:hypothetical protein
MPIAGTRVCVVKVRKPVEGKLPAYWSIHGPNLLNSRIMWNPPPDVKAHMIDRAAGYFFARWNSRAGRWTISNPAPQQEW